MHNRDFERAISRIKQIRRKYGDLKFAFQELCQKRSYTIPKNDLISEEQLQDVSKICADLFGIALQMKSQNFKFEIQSRDGEQLQGLSKSNANTVIACHSLTVTTA